MCIGDSGVRGSQWLDAGSPRLRLAALLMPFAGISFLWFIGVVRDGLGRYEDRFFASVFLGSGLLFLAMLFASSAVGAGLVAISGTSGRKLAINLAVDPVMVGAIIARALVSLAV